MRVLVVGDYGQLEPRLFAHFSQDPRLLRVYRPGGSGDVYVDMADGIFGECNVELRNICKTLVLAMGYGASDKRVGSILTVNGYPTDVETGAEYVQDLRETYPVFFQWREQVIARVKKTGYVETIGGGHRRLKAQFVDRRNWKNIGYGERQAVNAIIQGSAGDIVRRVMVRSCREFPELALLIQVHDELVWEAEDRHVSADLLARLQVCGEEGHGFTLRVPLSFEPHVGLSWYQAKEETVFELPADMVDDDTSLGFEED